MTLAVEYPSSSYTAAGAPGETFAVGFSFASDDELRVTFAGVAKSAGVDFLVTGDRLGGGALVNPISGHEPGAGAAVAITRATPKDQPYTFGNSGQLTPAQVGASFDRVTRMIQELARDVGLGGGGGGGGGGTVFWADIPDKPSTFPPSAHTHAYSTLTGLPTLGALAAKDTVNNADWSGTDLSVANGGTGASTAAAARTALGLAIGTDVQAYHANLAAAAGAGTPAADKILKWTSSTAAVFVDIPAGGGGGGGSMQPRLLSDVGTIDGGGVNTASNDATITAAEAAADTAFTVPDGIYKKTAATPAFSNLTKGYRGRGIFREGTSHVPGNFSYMGAAPTVPATQGITGWFASPNLFTDGGEYRVIGPNVQTYNLPFTRRYFEAAYIPHHAWFDVNSGNSGVQAYATGAGFTPAQGTSIPIRGNADSAWIGKTVGFATAADGAPVETRTVVGVSGSTVTINAALSSTYAWNPSAGLTPCLLFGKRTWSGHEYRKITAGADGGGDVYGTIWRTTNNYVPKASEFHTFMAATTGLCGGDQYLGAHGVYQTGWENLQSDKPGATAFEGASIGFVNTQSRNTDNDLAGGRFWAHAFFKSEGIRPTDVGVGIFGMHRNAFDTVGALLLETERLQDPTVSGATTIKVTGAYRNSFWLGEPLTIGEAGAVVYTGVIDGIPSSDSQVLTVSPALPATVIPAGTLVTFPRGGAALNVGDYQKIVFGSTRNNGYRSGDSTGVYPAFYGNVHGGFVMESGSDGSGAYVSLRAPKMMISGTVSGSATPDFARFRLRQNGSMQFYTTAGVSITGNVGVVGDVSVTATGNRFVLANGVWLVADGATIKGTVNNGGTYTTLVS